MKCDETGLAWDESAGDCAGPNTQPETAWECRLRGSMDPPRALVAPAANRGVRWAAGGVGRAPTRWGARQGDLIRVGRAIHRDSAPGGESEKRTAVVVHINWVGPGHSRKSTRPRANGTVERLPLESLDRLADLVPPPRKHRHCLPPCHKPRVFAPTNKLRRAVTALAIGIVGKPGDAATGGHASDDHTTGDALFHHRCSHS